MRIVFCPRRSVRLSVCRIYRFDRSADLTLLLNNSALYAKRERTAGDEMEGGGGEGERVKTRATRAIRYA